MRNQKILIVDDDEDFAEALAQLCRSWGYVPTVVYSGKGALRELDEEIFDFAIIDNIMPEEKGIDLVGSMRRNHFHLPVAICTGFETSDLVSKMHNLRISDVVTKPFDHQRMKSLIESNLKIH